MASSSVDNELAYRTAGELASELAQKRVSAVELVDAAIARIYALDGKINAVVVRDFDRARAAAQAADSALARGKRQPLLGLPITSRNSTTSPACRPHGATPNSATGILKTTRWSSRG
jgi:Asp-tRNA(Asn)/Glu-tRNA(Gln) amidotransferase A subunit family amidase